MRSSLAPQRTGGGGLVSRFARTLAAIVFLDPFALILAAAGGWLTVLSALALARTVASDSGESICGVVGCSVYLGVLGLITMLALAHLVITGLAGWGAVSRTDSAP